MFRQSINRPKGQDRTGQDTLSGLCPCLSLRGSRGQERTCPRFVPVLSLLVKNPPIRTDLPRAACAMADRAGAPFAASDTASASRGTHTTCKINGLQIRTPWRGFPLATARQRKAADSKHSTPRTARDVEGGGTPTPGAKTLAPTPGNGDPKAHAASFFHVAPNFFVVLA